MIQKVFLFYISLLLVLSAVYLSQVPVCAQKFQSMSGAQTDTASTQEAKQLQSTFLTGGISHSATLPAVEQQFKSGQNYNFQAMEAVIDKSENKLKASVQTNVSNAKRLDWFKLPRDLNGTFVTDHYYVVYSKDLKTGSISTSVERKYAKYDLDFGVLRDTTGAVWTYFTDVWNSKVESDTYFTQQFYKTDRLAYVDQGRLAEYQQWRSVKVDRKTNKIQYTRQVEAISNKYLIGPDTLREDISMREFDQQGKPIVESRIIRVTKRRNYYNSKPTSAELDSFRLFLTEKGWMDLFPG
jgi:hypothetical protein